MAKPTSVSRMRSTRKTPEESIRGQPFRHADFMNICTYLESPQHYNTLFGIGPITPVGTANRSKVTAYNIFADWMNERNPALQLTGRGLSHRLTSYKRLYTNAKNHEDPSCNEVDKGHRKDSHTEILEQLCPCFERMDHIFGNQVDISPILLSDQPLRDSGIITVTNWLAGHTFLSLAKVFLVLAFIILLTTHIPLSFCPVVSLNSLIDGTKDVSQKPSRIRHPNSRSPQSSLTKEIHLPGLAYSNTHIPLAHWYLFGLPAWIWRSYLIHSANLPDIALTQDHTNPVGHG
ncbi:hypothetical protein MJO29_001466 [Puccinia striiformis f. sp. tritici]|nr:hypothetical protein MJO29_001466 [Puccinia striiformis f. sp. tritici]